MGRTFLYKGQSLLMQCECSSQTERGLAAPPSSSLPRLLASMPRVKISTPVDGSIKCLAVYRLSDRMMVAIYALGHHTEPAFREVMKKIMSANPSANHPRLTVTDPNLGAIHYETEQDAVFFALTAADYPQRVVFQCIGELRARFNSGLSDALANACEGGLSSSARPLMAELCSRYADAASVDKTLSVTRQVHEVRGIVGETIQALLASQENLEVLEDRSEVLRDQSRAFKKTSHEVKVTQRKKNTRLLSLTCIFIIIGAILVASPFVVMYWDEIVDFFEQMMPPASSQDWASGDIASGA